MAGTPLKSTRDANLDKLKGAVDDWADKEIKRIQNENKFMQDVLKGRGSGSSATLNLSKATEVAVADIQEFLTGG